MPLLAASRPRLVLCKETHTFIKSDIIKSDIIKSELRQQIMSRPAVGPWQPQKRQDTPALKRNLYTTANRSCFYQSSERSSAQHQGRSRVCESGQKTETQQRRPPHSQNGGTPPQKIALPQCAKPHHINSGPQRQSQLLAQQGIPKEQKGNVPTGAHRSHDTGTCRQPPRRVPSLPTVPLWHRSPLA